MRFLIILITFVVLLIPIEGFCQLSFRPPTDDGINFGEVPLMQEREFIQTIVLENGRGRASWRFQGDADCFSFNPRSVFLEEGGTIEQEITLTFRPEEAVDYQVMFLVTFENEEDGNQYIRGVITTGTGLGGNSPPEVAEEIGDLELEEDFEEFAVADLDDVFTDPDGNIMRFTAESNEENLSVRIVRDNILRMESVENWFGETTVLLTASDREETTEYSFLVVVQPVNDPPVTRDTLCVVLELDFIDITPIVYDPDGDDLELLLVLHELPQEAELIEDENGVIHVMWQTTYENSGEYDIRFTYSDGEFEETAYVWISIMDLNRPPVWISIPDSVEVVEDQILEFIVEGSDPDEAFLFLSMSSQNLPDSAQFTDNEDYTGTFVWRPLIGNAGDYSAIFQLTDAFDTVWAETSIRVIDPNSAPGIENETLPDNFALNAIYPNPFNSSTTIYYNLPGQVPVIIDICNIRGQIVDVLVDGIYPIGSYNLVWDAKDMNAGVYFVRVRTEGGSKKQEIRKVVLVR